MDSDDSRQTQQPPADGAGGDRRSQPHYDARQRIVKTILETLKKHLPSSGQEEVQELWITANRLEEEAYNAATSQMDYINRISFKMLLTMESIAIPSNSEGISRNPQDPASSYTNAQTGMSDSELQEEVYLKIRTMEELHYSEIRGIYQKVCSRIEQITESFLMSRLSAVDFCNKKLPGLEKKIRGTLKSYMIPPLQQGQIPPFLQQNPLAHYQITQAQSHENASSVSTALTNISEAEKEFYQKVKDYYCQDLRETKNICQELSLKLEKLQKMLEKDGLSKTNQIGLRDSST